MLEMTAAKFWAFCIPDDMESANFRKICFLGSIPVSYPTSVLVGGAASGGYFSPKSPSWKWEIRYFLNFNKKCQKLIIIVDLALCTGYNNNDSIHNNHSTTTTEPLDPHIHPSNASGKTLNIDKKEGPKTMLEMTATKLWAFSIPDDMESVKFRKIQFLDSIPVSYPTSVLVGGAPSRGYFSLTSQFWNEK